MRIRSFHIDGFGIFSNEGVDDLAPGFSIFLGDNEAGKSTCLDFLRVMLTGYPDPRSKEARERTTVPLRGGQAGGALRVDTRKHGLVRLTRRPGNGGGAVTLTDAQGHPLDVGWMDQMLAGVTREVYRNVFGFSLSELQTFATLNSEGVRHALYGASFGMGLRAPGHVLRSLEEHMEGIFKGNGSKPALNAALREWDTLRQEIQAAEEECAHFDALTEEKNSCSAALAAVRQQRQEIERQCRDVDRRLGVWRQWDEWRTARSRLERLEDVVETFPQDGPARLERAQQILLEATRTAQLQQERLDRARVQWEATSVDEMLLRTLPRLQTLAERKSSYRHALGTLPTHLAALQRARVEQRRLLLALGPHWTCDRIRATDRSLFAREEMERQAAAMQAAATTHVAAIDVLEKANRGVDTAEQALLAARAGLDRLPVPVAALAEAGRDTLRRILAYVEETRQRLPERRQALHAARVTFSRTYTPLHMHPGETPDRILETLAHTQDKALELAANAQSTLGEAQAAAQVLTQAQASEEGAKGRVDRLRTQQRKNQGPTRNVLDTRTAALRLLRHLHSVYTVEQDRMAEVETRLAGMTVPAPMKSLPLIATGVLLMLVGAAILLARWQLGITSLPLTQQMTLPITLWSGYLVVLTGVGFLAGGLPRSGPEAQRHAVEVEQLQQRRQSSRQRMDELEAQMLEQCVVAEVVNADPVTLDATELLLERARELCVTDERLNLEMAALEAELVTLRERTRQAQQHSTQVESAVQQARRRWHDFLLSCHVDKVPAPEAAAAFFARVEAARLAQASLSALEEEILGMETHLAMQEEAACLLPPVAERLEEGTARGDTLMEAIRSVLEACREADAAEEERLKAAAALHNAEINADRASNAQGEAMDALRRSDDALGAAREAWASILEELGLGLELSPGTVREALECMERCLAAEAEVIRMEDERVRLEQEIDAVVLPLRAIEASLGRPDQMTGDKDDVDGVTRLDTLLAAAQEAEAMSRQRVMLTIRLEEVGDELSAAQRALTDAKEGVRALLDMAQVDSVEEFLRLAAVQAQRRELHQRMEDLEDTLRLAADNTPLHEFLESFMDVDRHEGEALVVSLGHSITVMQEEEQNLSTKLVTCSATLQSLTTGDRLAALRQQEAALSESMRTLAHEWSRHALARHLLAQAKQCFERERQPHVIRTASEIFAAITDHRWCGLAASLEDSSLSVLSPHGEPVAPEHLSRGTQEQIYLAMRLAYIRNHATHAAPLPVIMDDILVNFDPQRARRTARVLATLAGGEIGEQGHQVLFFTCHPHIADMLHEIMPTSGRYRMDNGSIRKA